MRLRPLAALSIAAVSAILLVGCAGSGEGAASGSPTAAPAADLCDAQVSSGAAADAVTVSGDAGAAPTLSFTAPLQIDALQAKTIDKGTGDPVVAGDFISYAMTAYDAETGQKMGDIGYQAGQLLPAQISASSPLGQVLGCGAPGERVVATFPASEQGGAQVYVVDLLSVVPSAAWGAAQAPVAGMPTVELGDNGAPKITLPGGNPPAETQIATLKKGDGATVQSGDQVLVQYTGVRWSNGETFDSTWDKGGVPTSFTTTGVVPGFRKALEGQTVGSQVLVVMPPADGYGDGEINTTDLKGETLVFVVDILGAATSQSQ